MSAILADKPLAVTDGKASVTEAQLDSIEAPLADKDRIANERQQKIDAHEATIREKDATIADLQAKLAKKPAEESKQVVDSGSKGESADKTETEIYCDTVNSARKLFNEV